MADAMVQSFSADCGPMVKGLGKLTVASPNVNLASRMIFGVVPDIPRLRLELLAPTGQPYFRLAMSENRAEVQLPEEEHIRVRDNMDEDLKTLVDLPVPAALFSYFLAGCRVPPGWRHANFAASGAQPSESLILYYPQWEGYLRIGNPRASRPESAVWMNPSGDAVCHIRWAGPEAPSGNCFYTSFSMSSNHHLLNFHLLQASSAPIPSEDIFRLTVSP